MAVLNLMPRLPNDKCHYFSHSEGWGGWWGASTLHTRERSSSPWDCLGFLCAAASCLSLKTVTVSCPPGWLAFSELSKLCVQSQSWKSDIFFQANREIPKRF